jgi:hypothetical protein
MSTTMTTITVAAAAVPESISDSSGGDCNSDGWGGGIGNEGDSNGSGNDSNDGNNGGSCNSNGDNDGNDAGNDEDGGHDDDDKTVVAVRAAGATKTTMVTAMAGGTNNNQLKAQLCPAHNGNEDNMLGMCLAMVAVAAMLVWEGGSAKATVEEAATAAAEEGRGGQWVGWPTLCNVFFFSTIIFFTITTTATEGRGNVAAAVISSAGPFS